MRNVSEHERSCLRAGEISCHSAGTDEAFLRCVYADAASAALSGQSISRILRTRKASPRHESAGGNSV